MDLIDGVQKIRRAESGAAQGDLYTEIEHPDKA